MLLFLHKTVFFAFFVLISFELRAMAWDSASILCKALKNTLFCAILILALGGKECGKGTTLRS